MRAWPWGERPASAGPWQRSVEAAAVGKLNVEVLGVEPEAGDLFDQFRSQSPGCRVIFVTHGLGPPLIDGVTKAQTRAVTEREPRLGKRGVGV